MNLKQAYIVITGRNEVSAKVIFSQACAMNSVHRGGVCSKFSGGGVCSKFWGGLGGLRGSAPNFRGGCLLQIWGCLLQIFGGCLLQIFGGVWSRGGSSNFRNTVTVRPVRILLECILVDCNFNVIDTLGAVYKEFGYKNHLPQC